MQKIAVFGKPGGGKSTFSRNLSNATGIELYPLDLIEYKKNGERVSADIYSAKHAELVALDNWIIDGLGTLPSFWERIDMADTLVYIDLPYRIHYWWVTKRLLKSPIIKPEGWPDGCSVLKGTIGSVTHLRKSPRFWTSDLFEKIQLRASDQNIIRITTVKELSEFVTKHKR